MQIIDATTPEQFQQLLAEHPRVLVDFHKDQCPGCRMLEMSLHRVANSVAGQGTPLLCVHLEEGVPVQLEDRYVNPELIPKLLEQDFGAQLQPASYLLQVIRPDEMEHIVEAGHPSDEEARVLQMETDEACLVLLRRTWSAERAVTYVRLVHPSSRYRLWSRVRV